MSLRDWVVIGLVAFVMLVAFAALVTIIVRSWKEEETRRASYRKELREHGYRHRSSL